MGIVDEKKLFLNSSVGRPTLDTVLERVPVEIQSQLGEENEVAIRMNPFSRRNSSS